MMKQIAILFMFILVPTVLKAQSKQETIDWLQSKIKLYSGYDFMDCRGSSVHLRTTLSDDTNGRGIRFDLNDIISYSVDYSGVNIVSYGYKIKIYDVYVDSGDRAIDDTNPSPYDPTPQVTYHDYAKGDFTMDFSAEPNLRERFLKALSKLAQYNQTASHESY